MGKIETLGILQEIEALISDKLQVVSYKWLSRNFLVSSTAAKKLLQEFVETRGNGLEVVYTLSGWLKTNPSTYHIALVSGSNLEDAKLKFDGKCSIQVYSVQVCIPKDPAALWNTEFVQTEELFKQPSTVNNCMRDNRFSGIFNSFVKRHVDGTAVSNTAPQPKGLQISGPSKIVSAHQNIAVPPQIKVQQSSSKFEQQSHTVVTVVHNVKTESNGTGVHDAAAKPSADSEKIPFPASNKKKGQIDKSSSGNGSSLANLFGRASAKSKPTSSATDNKTFSPNTASADAQICFREAIEDASSDDDTKDANFKRASKDEGSRKRRIVLDYSDDEYEDAVNLASPDLAKGQSSKTLFSEEPNFNEKTEVKPEVKEEKSTGRASEPILKEDSSVSDKNINSKTFASEKIHSLSTGDDVKKATSAPLNSPKRRKVLKTRIDDRGREVTEVVREGEETETKKDDNNTMKKAEIDAVTDTKNRALGSKKSPAVGNTAPSNPGGKAGNKKGGNKDPKQGNIMSFFKRV